MVCVCMCWRSPPFLSAFVSLLAKGCKCFPAFQQFIRVFSHSFPAADRPIPALGPADVEHLRQLVSNVRLGYLPTVQNRVYPFLVDLLLRFGVPSALTLQGIGRVLTQFPPHVFADSDTRGKLRVWLCAERDASTVPWFPSALTEATAHFLRREGGDGVDSMDPSALAQFVVTSCGEEWGAPILDAVALPLQVCDRVSVCVCVCVWLLSCS